LILSGGSAILTFLQTATFKGRDMSINWNNLRSWSGSQQTAFEELCCQLASCEEMPNDAIFIRKASPDAGVECFWKLQDGTEHGWQAKYFLNPPDNAQWRQIDESIQTALEKHPLITKYVVCLPINRPDARETGKKSCLDKWNDHVAKWKRWSDEKKMQIEFMYWGESEIFQRLSRDKHRGRYLFWFNSDIFTHQKMLDQINESIENVGPRYTPELNIHLELSNTFEFIARTDKYVLELRKNIGLIHRKLSCINPKDSEQYLQEPVNKIILLITELLKQITRFTFSAVDIVDLGILSDSFQNLQKLLWECEEMIYKAKLDEFVSKHNKKPEEMSHYYPSEKHDRWSYNIRQVREAINNLHVYIKGNNAQLAINPSMLLSGAAGSGKTHLLCDIAKERINRGLPTVLLLGQNFYEGDLWEQIIKQLHLNCSTRDELLGILNAAGQASGSRALLIVDAINESVCKKIWTNNLAGILYSLSQYPWVGVVLSIRNTYFEYMIPPQLIKQRKFTVVSHEGFAGIEYKAMREFFQYYKIKQPDIPLLNPEFKNPLFLKLFCRGLNNSGKTEFPRGSQNITKVYENFIDSVNNKLSNENILNYDPRDKIVWKVVEELAGKMAERRDSRIPLDEAKEIANKILPSNGYHNSLFYHLETEGIITETITYKKGSSKEAIQFSYERFADHLIAKYLLDTHLNKDTPDSSFKDGQPLAKLFASEFYWHYEGLIEAISIQLPERIGKELIEFIPQYANLDFVQQAFLDSLIWRDPESLNERTKDIINKYIIKNNFDQLMETFITVATLKDHPFNADALHKYLLKLDLPYRDATWSKFLFYQIEENGAVDRLIDWAWSPEDKSHIDDSSILLAAKTLAWFLTTSQRYLRDRATKAMVNLLTNRVELLPTLIEDFKNADDPYIQERLYAVAYGCAMRTTEKNKICNLANYIYENIFKDETPPINVLLRDYARGVIELALHYGLKINVCLKKIRPPYKSRWPEDIPSKDELEKLYSYDNEKADEHLRRLYHHIASSGFSDFNRYIIDCNNWTSRRKGEPKKITNKERYNSFVESLTNIQKKAWDELCKCRSSVFHIILSSIDKQQVTEIKPTPDDEKHLEEAENYFIKTLGGKKRSVYFEFVIPYLNSEFPHDEYDYFDKSIAESFIFKRVLDLGWSPKLHAEFDENRYDIGRHSNKPERIGKKYQWIAYHELLALISDNFEYSEDSWSGDKSYEGPWQDYVRDIDPSYVLPGNEREYWTTSHSKCWWFPLTYNSWHKEENPSDWLQNTDDLPSSSNVIEVKKEDGSTWLSLEGFYHFREPVPPEEETYEKERREIWYMIKSYLLKKSEIGRFYNWAKTKNFSGRWMPESHENTRIFIGEFFWSPAFDFQNKPYYSHEGWTQGRGGGYEIPVPVLVTTDQYLQESSCYDCSIQENVNIYLPTKTIADEMELCWNGHEGEWYDRNGNLVAFDPSVRVKGPGSLLFKKDLFMNYLDEKGYDIVWTILGEKNLIGGSVRQNDWKGRLDISGIGRLHDGKIVTDTHYDFQRPNPQN
jgi:hypothetical protein